MKPERRGGGKEGGIAGEMADTSPAVAGESTWGRDSLSGKARVNQGVVEGSQKGMGREDVTSGGVTLKVAEMLLNDVLAAEDGVVKGKDQRSSRTPSHVYPSNPSTALNPQAPIGSFSPFSTRRISGPFVFFSHFIRDPISSPLLSPPSSRFCLHPQQLLF